MNYNAKEAVIRRGKHEIVLDPPHFRGGSVKTSWNMRLNGYHIPFWPKTKAEGREIARQLLDAIERAE